jgi:hypothetical protein
MKIVSHIVHHRAAIRVRIIIYNKIKISIGRIVIMCVQIVRIVIVIIENLHL